MRKAGVGMALLAAFVAGCEPTEGKRADEPPMP